MQRGLRCLYERKISRLLSDVILVSCILALQAFLWLFFSMPLHSVMMWSDAVTGYNYGVSSGEWWRLVTPMFYTRISLTFCLTPCLSFIRAPLEQMLGKVRFLIVYIASGIIGNIGTYLAEPLDYVHVGASGAIFGLFGVYVFLTVFRKELIGGSVENDYDPAYHRGAVDVYQL